MEGYIMQNKKKIDLKNIQYKAKLQNKVRDKNIKVKQPISICITLLNICEYAWPDDLQFECIEGIYDGFYETVIAVIPQQDVNINLNLIGPNVDGKFNTFWRLSYMIGNGKKYFGP